jgi:septum site-determining protein MinC
MNQKVKQNPISVREKLSLVDDEARGLQLLNPTKVIKKTIRSGQAVIHDGDVMLIGNLNDGGEIISAGNIVVIGEARGVIRAGSKGNEGSIIYATIMNPELIQIATHVIHISELVEDAVAYLRGGKILVQRFDLVKFNQPSNVSD